jgi:hypothetical protein
VPEMGPVRGGYNLAHLPNSWEEAVRLRPLLEAMWHDLTGGKPTKGKAQQNHRKGQEGLAKPESVEGQPAKGAGRSALKSSQ